MNSAYVRTVFKIRGWDFKGRLRQRRFSEYFRNRDLRRLSSNRSSTFLKLFRITWNFEKSCSTVGRRSSDIRRLSRDRSATFFKKKFELLETSKKGVWQSADDCRVIVQRRFWKKNRFSWNVEKSCFKVSRLARGLWPLSRDCSSTFPKFCNVCLKVQMKLFDSRPTVAWPPTIVATVKRLSLFPNFLSNEFRIR